MSRFTGKTLQRAPASRVKLSELSSDVGERKVAELIDDRIELGAGAEIRVLIGCIAGRVEVGLSLAPTLEEALAVQPGHDRHVRRVGALLVRSGVEGFHDVADGSFSMPPDLLHDLGLEFVERWWNLDAIVAG
jgi:hypothetical protein